MKYPKVVKDLENPESVEILAASIIKISDGMEKFLGSQLNEKALVTLLHQMIGTGNITKSEIKTVLWALPRLKGWYIKK